MLAAAKHPVVDYYLGSAQKYLRAYPLPPYSSLTLYPVNPPDDYTPDAWSNSDGADNFKDNAFDMWLQDIHCTAVKKNLESVGVYTVLDVITTACIILPYSPQTANFRAGLELPLRDTWFALKKGIVAFARPAVSRQY